MSKLSKIKKQKLKKLKYFWREEAMHLQEASASISFRLLPEYDSRRQKSSCNRVQKEYVAPDIITGQVLIHL